MAKNKKKDKKQGFSIYWLFGKLGDLLFIPIIVISLFSSVSMLIQNGQNKPTTIAGYSFVNILSGSMTNQGFIKGDTVITKQTSIDDIQLGDVIAFYNYRDPLDTKTQKYLVVCYNYKEGELEVDFSDDNISTGIAIDSIQKSQREKEKTVEDAQKRIGELFNESQCAVSAVLPKKE